MLKLLKNVDQCFPKPKIISSNVLFCPQPKNNHFFVIEAERNQKIFTFKKLESENFDSSSNDATTSEPVGRMRTAPNKVGL